MRIACLHTVDSNITVLDAAAASLPGATLSHHVRADLLQRAEAAGGLYAQGHEVVAFAQASMAAVARS